MEVGQGQNWGCSVEGKKIKFGDSSSDMRLMVLSAVNRVYYHYDFTNRYLANCSESYLRRSHFHCSLLSIWKAVIILHFSRRRRKVGNMKQ
jgi:hypothetical protein